MKSRFLVVALVACAFVALAVPPAASAAPCSSGACSRPLASISRAVIERVWWYPGKNLLRAFRARRQGC